MKRNRFKLAIKISLLFAVLSPMINFAGQAFGFPLMDGQGTSVEIHLFNRSRSITVYEDAQEPLVFWWAPYQAQVMKNPITRTPKMHWSAFSGSPNISVTSGLIPYPSAIKNQVTSQIATLHNLSVENIDLRILPLSEIALQLDFYDTSRKIPGVWHGSSSLLASYLPESIPLSEEANNSFLRFYDLNIAGMNVRLEYLAKTLGYQTPAFVGRKYNPSCVFSILSRGRSPEDSLNTKISERRMRLYINEIEKKCVTEIISRGNFSHIFDIWKGWPAELEDLGIIASQDKKWFFPSIEKILAFIEENSRILSFESEASLRAYPVSFSTYVKGLKPSRL